MTTDSSPLAPGELAALDAIPLFPLPGIALFPRAKMALHVFEPRYRSMLSDALDSHKLIAMVRIADEATLNRYGNPELSTLAGVGRILSAEKLADGRSNIVLEGLTRARISELPFVGPYRKARAEPLASHGIVSEHDRLALLGSITAFLTDVRKLDAGFDPRLAFDSDLEVLIDEVAQQLIVGPLAKIALFEELDLSARVALVLRELAVQRRTLDSGTASLDN